MVQEQNGIYILYHGSNTSVVNPEIRTTGFYKDFGYGFYCTKIEKQARKHRRHYYSQCILGVDKIQISYTSDSLLFAEIAGYTEIHK